MAFTAPLPATTGGDLNTASWTTGTAVPPTPLTKPTNLTNGDGLFFLAYDQVAASTVTTPSTFTAQYHTTATSTRGFYLSGKQIPSAAAETATNYSTTDSNSGRGLAAVFRIPGANMTTLLDAAPASDVYSAVAASSMSVPGVTAASGGALHVICVFANGTGGVTHTFAATGYTVLFTVNVNNAGSTSSMAVLYKVLTATGATGAVTVNMTPSDAVTNPASFGGFSITEAASPVAATGTAAITFDGTASGVAAGGSTGTAPITFSATATARAAATGTAAVTFAGRAEIPSQSWVRRLAGGTQYIGHRGGAWATYGEETRACYNATANWLSTAALEISFWATSDGVYVASHDQTTGRVFSGTSLDIPTNTWASMSAKTTLVGGNPIATVDQIIADHLGRIFVIENKQNTNNTTRAAYIDALCSGRWISKCFGPSGIGWCNSAAAFGAPAMAYFFPTDLGNIANAFTGWTGSTQLIYEIADYSSSGSALPVQSDANTFYAYTQAHSLMSWASVIDTSTQRTSANSQASTAGSTLDGYMMSNLPALVASDATTAATATAAATFAATATPTAAATGTAVISFAGTATAAAADTATAGFTFTATATGKAAATGTASVAFAGTGTGAGVSTGTAAATFTGTATAAAPATGTAVIAFAGSGTAAGRATATAAVTFSGAAPATAAAAGTAAVTFSATATGVLAGGATAAIVFTATATAGAGATGTATASFTGLATPATSGAAAGTAAATFTATATGAGRATGTAAITFTATGTGFNPAGVRDIDITVTVGATRHPATSVGASRHPSVTTGPQRWDT